MSLGPGSGPQRPWPWKRSWSWKQSSGPLALQTPLESEVGPSPGSPGLGNNPDPGAALALEVSLVLKAVQRPWALTLQAALDSEVGLKSPSRLSRPKRPKDRAATDLRISG